MDRQLFVGNLSAILALNVLHDLMNESIKRGIFPHPDFAPAGSVGARSYQLNLAVSGNVFDPVPEPASWMFMLLGFGLVGAVARRRAAGQPG